MRVLITGGSSLLGKYLILTSPDNYDISATWYTNYIGLNMVLMSLNNLRQINYVFSKIKPDLVIHCAGNGDVDFAERNYSDAHKVNVTGTENILGAAKKYKAKFIYISSNAVFSGNNPPYDSDSSCNPVNIYGKLKRMAERLVMDYEYDWMVIRPFMLYGIPWPNARRNWLVIILDKLIKGQSIKLVNDIVWQPTHAIDCASVIWHFSRVASPGFHNIAAPEVVTLYEFGLKIARVFDLDSSFIEGVSSSYFNSLAKRPIDTSYALDHVFVDRFKVLNIEDGLENIIREYKKNEL